jgi:hypothetical protein
MITRDGRGCPSLSVLEVSKTPAEPVQGALKHTGTVGAAQSRPARSQLHICYGSTRNVRP